MAMFNPPHPGEFIQEIYLRPNEISCREFSLSLGVAPSTVSRVLNAEILLAGDEHGRRLDVADKAER